MKELLEPVLLPLRAVLVALLGLWLAWSWFMQSNRWLPVTIVFCLIVFAHLLDAIGRKQLPDRPVLALIFMEFWVLSPLMWAALGACAVVIVAVALTVEENTTTATKELTKALAAAITTFLTSGFVAWAGDQDRSPVARRIRRSFERAYKGVKLPENAERLIYSDAVGGIEGWSLSARFERASRLAAELRSIGSGSAGGRK